jgi:hypothetical protein
MTVRAINKDTIPEEQARNLLFFIKFLKINRL